MPIAQLIIAVKVFANLGQAAPRRAIDKIQPHLVGQHGAYRVKIAGVEAVDVACQQLALVGIARRRLIVCDTLG